MGAATLACFLGQWRTGCACSFASCLTKLTVGNGKDLFAQSSQRVAFGAGKSKTPRLCDLLGLKRFTPHDLRRTARVGGQGVK